ncbi:toluene 4-monooxygenase protein D [Haloechinothrix alba]|uniref:Toluene 4-monooxygenase protein D n=1 Tax=Haloechinothrix alba TaxID=664784 RepID=A0A238YWN2_9PSEU|nr:MmoB/DmpM family protein [Haloechinothrix alba]SNR75555.1 toluene 4-monooxygenase protein D [Haloechinothrix alba]
MSATSSVSRPVGPILQSGDVAEAVADAAKVDNPDSNVEVRDHGAYVRVEVDGGECVLRRATIEEELGRPFKMSELEIIMSSFTGRIDTGNDEIRFYR